jgi:hypothetical protein
LRKLLPKTFSGGLSIAIMSFHSTENRCKARGALGSGEPFDSLAVRKIPGPLIPVADYHTEA